MADTITLSWLQKHERLIIVFLVLLVGAWGFNKWVDSAAKTADLKQAIANQQLTDSKSAAKDAADTYKATLDIVTQQNSVLNRLVTQRNGTLKQQQTVDKTLPLPETVKRWEALTETNDIDFTNPTVSSITVSSKAATQTLVKLEEVPVLQQNVLDTQAQVDNYKKVIDKDDQVVVSLNSEIGKQDAACKAEVAAVKADNNRSKRNWFLRGMAVGATIVGYIALHI